MSIKDRIERVIAKRIMTDRPVKLSALRRRPDTKPIIFEELRTGLCTKCGNEMKLRAGQGRARIVCDECRRIRQLEIDDYNARLAYLQRLDERIIEAMDKPMTFDEIAEKFDDPPETIRQRLTHLYEKHRLRRTRVGRISIYRRKR